MNESRMASSSLSAFPCQWVNLYSYSNWPAWCLIHDPLLIQIFCYVRRRAIKISNVRHWCVCVCSRNFGVRAHTKAVGCSYYYCLSIASLSRVREWRKKKSLAANTHSLYHVMANAKSTLLHVILTIIAGICIKLTVVSPWNVLCHPDALQTNYRLPKRL